MPSGRSKQYMSTGSKPKVKPKSKSSSSKSKGSSSPAKADVRDPADNSALSLLPSPSLQDSSPSPSINVVGSGGDGGAFTAKEPTINGDKASSNNNNNDEDHCKDEVEGDVKVSPGSVGSRKRKSSKKRPLCKGEGGDVQEGGEKGFSSSPSPIFRVRRPSERRDSERSNRSDKGRVADTKLSKNTPPPTPPRSEKVGNGSTVIVSQSWSSSSLSADAPPFVAAVGRRLQQSSLSMPQKQQQQHQQQHLADIRKGMVTPKIILKRGEPLPEDGNLLVVVNAVERETDRKKTTAPLREASGTSNLLTSKDVSPIPPQIEMKHPLQHQWTLWYFCNEGRHAAWESGQKVVKTVEYIEDFWALYNFIKSPSELRANCDYSLFKRDIKPMWEDVRNSDGGRWLINLDKCHRMDDVLDERWLEVLLFLIGGTMDEKAYGRYINGAVVSLRNKGDKIGVWLEVTDRTVITEVGNKLKSLLNLQEQIHFEMHSDNKSKSGSIARVLLKM